MAASLQLRLTGGAANSDPAASLGGVMSANQVHLPDTIDASPAVDKGNGRVGIPITGHLYAADKTIIISGTTNYDGSRKIESQTANEVVIVATYAAETFDGTETTEITLNNLFDNVDPGEASAGDTEYRAIDVYNAGDAAATSVSVHMSTETSSPDTALDLGHDATNDPHTSAWAGETIADEDTAPASPVITFGHHLSANKLSLPDIPVGHACRVWLKRVVSAAAGNTSNDQGTFRAEYA